MGKPQGFGKIKITSNLEGLLENREIEFMILFEKTMNKFIGNGEVCKWINSPQIIELFSMAYDRETEANDLLLSYMKMSNTPEENEFLLAKTSFEYLQKYTVISQSDFVANSISKDIEQEEQEKARKDAELKKILDQKAKEDEIIQKEEAAKKAREEKEEKLKLEGIKFNLNCKNFDLFKKPIDEWKSKSKSEFIPDTHHQILLENIKLFYDSLGKNDKQKWNVPFKNNPYWEKITSWVGSTKAEEWYNHITK
jgi:hypothetical protein